MSLTITLDVHRIYRADLLAFSVTIHNDTGSPIPAGLRVGVFGSDGGKLVAYWTFTFEEALPTGDTRTSSGSGPMGAKEADMEFSARVLEPGEPS